MACFLIPYICLDEEFDAPDIAADYQLCHAIAAGKMGLHPDAWGNHDGLARAPLPARNWDDDFVATPPVERSVEEPPKPEPKLKPWSWQRPKPPPVWPAWHPPPSGWSDPDGGDIKLTCDDCGQQFAKILRYPPGLRPSYVRMIRLMGQAQGWTCIVGRDRCPKCSECAPPQAVGNGAGEHQGNEQHG